MKAKLGLFILFLVMACKPRVEPTCQVLLLAPRSGAQAAIGHQITRARELVEARAKGTLAERIRIVEVDTAGRPEQARAEVERHLGDPTMGLVVGSILSTETREFLQDALSKGMTVLANGSSDPQIRALPFRKAHDHFFRNWPADDREGASMATYLIRSRRALKLAVLHANDAYARSLSQKFQTSFRELGGTVLEPVSYPSATTTFDPLIERFVASKPDGFYVVGFPTDLAGFYNTLRRRPDTKALPMYSAVGIESGDFKALAVGPLDNLFYTSPAVDESSREYFTFKQDYRSRFDDDSPDIVAATTYDALQISLQAIIATSCSPQNIGNYLSSMPTYRGATGPTAFDEMGDVVGKESAVKYFEKGQLRLAERNGSDQ